MKKNPRRIVILLGFGTAISLLGESTLYTVLPLQQYAVEMGVSLSMVGILLGANRMVRLVTNGPVGLIYERNDKRNLLTISLVLGSAASIIYSLGYGFVPLFIGRLIWGLGWSFQWIGCRTMILEISNKETRATMNGIYQMFFMAGVGFSSLIGSLLANRFGLRIQQQLSATIILMMALVWFFLLPRTSSSKIKEVEKKNRKNQVKLFRGVMPPLLVIMFITRFIERGVFASTMTLWVGALFGDKVVLFGALLTTAALAGIFNAVKFLPSMANAPFIGYISDRMQKRWIILIASTCITMVGIWLMTQDQLSTALMGSILVAFLGNSPETLVPAIIGDQVRRNDLSRTLGIIYIGADLGAMLGPMTALALLDANTMSLDQMYLGCIGLLVISVIISLRANSQKQ